MRRFQRPGRSAASVASPSGGWGAPFPTMPTAYWKPQYVFGARGCTRRTFMRARMRIRRSWNRHGAGQASPRSPPRGEGRPRLPAGRREEEQILKGYANGAVDYVVKPFSPETMIAKVRVFLEHYRREQHLRHEIALQQRERDEFERRERMARAEADAHREHLYALFMKAP